MTEAEQFASIRAGIMSELAALNDPNTRKISYSIDGVSVDWSAYRGHLWGQLARLREEQAAAGSGIGTVVYTRLA